VNLEVGLLRRILKKNKQWARLAEDVTMLPERPKEARVLSPDEKAHLLKTASLKLEWQVARCATVVALNTTMRGCELKGLRWKVVDLFEKVLRIRRQSTKTDAGARAIPLNRDAVVALGELWDRSGKLGAAQPDHFVFPACENGHVDPTRLMKTWRTAWRSLTKKAGLKGLRFHDLRHQCITELAESGQSDQTIMSIAGHVSREMLDHYSHIRLEAKRTALAALETPPPQPQPEPHPEQVAITEVTVD
jgi:integrase